MRLVVFLMVFTVVQWVGAKNSKGGASESLGQDVIELVNPIKELPPNLEEEPATEKEVDTDDDDDEPSLVPLPSSHAHTTRREAKKSSVSLKSLDTKKAKEVEKIDVMKDLREEDEEAKIEKELAEIYKDTDYKADALDRVAVQKTGVEGKPIGRSREDPPPPFQPQDLADKADVQRFRTSVDSVTCDGATSKDVLFKSKLTENLKANFAPSTAVSAAILAAAVAAAIAA